MTRRWWGAAVTAAVLVGVTACGGGSGGDGDPRSVIGGGARTLSGGGSAHFHGEFVGLGVGGAPFAADGLLTWRDAGGTDAELTSTGLVGNVPTTSRLTGGTTYVSTSGINGLLGGMTPPGMEGKQWVKQSIDDLTAGMGAFGDELKATVDQTNPVRSAALLVQARDLHEVGQEQRGGVNTTHYSGVVDYAGAVADLQLGLSQQTLDELRREIAATNTAPTEQVDLWVDDQGRPVHVEDSENGKVGYRADYTDYGPPQPITAPPADQVVDLKQIGAGLIPPH